MDTFGIGILLILVVFLLIKVQQLQGQIKQLKINVKQIIKTLKVPEDCSIDAKLITLIQQDQEIQAVKLVREKLGLSLIEGKKYIDQLKKRT